MSCKDAPINRIDPRRVALGTGKAENGSIDAGSRWLRAAKVASITSRARGFLPAAARTSPSAETNAAVYPVTARTCRANAL